MDTLDVARWQFGITTVYHFLMVPLTIGLGILVAVMHTMWVRTGKPEWLRMTRFWGRVYLVNFVLGVATGLVQEFQFGLAWSEYSRFVGDVFGSLLAMEALLAFFLESTFLGLWIFGWGRIPKRLHLASLWAAAIGSIVSAYFIIAANSRMQHPGRVLVGAAGGGPRAARRRPLDRPRLLHHRGQLLDAAPGRCRRRPRRPSAAGRLPRRADQQHRAGRLQPRDRRGARGRGRPAGRQWRPPR